MDITEVRASLDEALAQEGLEKKKLKSIGPKVWALPGEEVVRFFSAGGHRRPWGFVFDGLIGLEIPALRAWLDEYRPAEEAGIFRSYFVAYHTANDDALRGFMIHDGDPVPADLWAGLIADRLRELPESVDALIEAYRGDKERLGWLAHPHERHAWDFLRNWWELPDPLLHVPKMLPDGRIV